MNSYEKAISKYSNHYKRIKIVDFLRGFCALLMVFDHTMYDFRNVASYLWSPLNDFSRELIRLARLYYTSDLRAFGWICAVSCFVFLCGFSTGLSRNNLLRGFRLLVVSMLVTTFTKGMDIVMNSSNVVIHFGVLHTLAFCILIYAICIEGGKKIKLFSAPNRTYYLSDLLIILLFIASAIATITYGISASKFTTNIKFHSLTDMSFEEFWAYAIGICKTLPSSDYIPLLPWLTVFLTGAFFSGSIKKTRDYFPIRKPKKSNFISFIGKHSLILYIAHQPIIYVLIYIMGIVLTGNFILF